MAQENETPPTAKMWRLGTVVFGVALVALLAWALCPPIYRLPLSTLFLLSLLVLGERRRSAARERALVEAHSASVQAEACFRGVFENSPDIMCVHRIEADGSIWLERFNPAAARDRRIDETSRNRRLDELVPAHVYDKAKRVIDHVVATGETIRHEGVPGRDDPDTEIMVVPLGTSQGVERVFVSIRDLKHLREAQASSSRSEELYKVLADSTTDMITRLSIPDFRRVYVSPACRALLGFEPEELIGRSPVEDIHPADRGPAETIVARIKAGDLTTRPAAVAYRVRHKDGRWLWVETSTSFTRNAAGKVDGLICSIRDVDARRRAEAARAASETRFRLLAENASELIVLGHDDGRRSYISPASTRLVGFTPSELETEMLCKRWVHPDDIDYLAHAVLSPDDIDTAVSCRVRRKDGTWIWVEAIFRRIPSCVDGEPTIIATFRDITERHVQAEALREAKNAADVARCVAEQASRAKSDFLATMSHEIRTPLNAILGFADLLDADRTLQSESRRCLERIRTAGSTLRAVVDDILDFSKLEAGGVHLVPRPFSLAALIDNTASIVRGLAQKKQLELIASFDPATPALVIGDSTRLRQVLINLLNNAIKFTRQGSVALSLRVMSREDGAVGLRFRITDTGIGIASDKQAGIFQRFSQVDSSISREYGGTGLGLAICRTLVEAMGGTIAVESVVEQGSTFWFDLSLPVATAIAGLADPAGAVATSSDAFDDLVSTVGLGGSLAAQPIARPETIRPLRLGLDILLVEDVVLNQELIRSILEASGHRVDVVGNGSEALMAVEDKTYDLVLMDLQMPHVDGVAATRLIRNLAAPCRFVPIVALTAAVLREQTDAALAAGMNDVLTKPISLPDLRAVLEKAARDEVREAADPEALDHQVADQLARAIGDAKVRSMQALLEKSLTARFNTPLTQATVATLKAEAHASIAGAAMLGFVRFGMLCRAFIACEDGAAESAYDALRRELYHVVRTLQTKGEPNFDPYATADVA